MKKIGGKKMKKLMLFSLALVSLTVVGCGKKINYEEEMKTVATAHYEKYMKGVTGVDAHTVTLKVLRDTNKQGVTKYDLKKLEKCEDDSSVTLVLDKDKKEISKYEYNMKCK